MGSGAPLKGLLGVLAVAVALLFVPTASAATLTLSPTSGAAGTSVQASGTGFGRKLSGRIDFGGTPEVATFRTNPKGRFTASFGVPSGYSGSVSVTASTAAAAASASFDVTASPPPPPPPSGDPVITAAGDICGSSTDCKPTADLIQSIAPTNELTLGDNAYPDGSLSQYTSFYNPNWGLFKLSTKPTTGNHEFHTPNAQGYHDYFGAIAPDQYYSYDLGSWHLIALASSAGISPSAGGAEETWLRQDLAAHPSQCTLAYWHEPRFSSGTTHGSDSSWSAVWQDLYSAGVELVLNGHEHNYERFAPQTPTGLSDPSGGIVEVVSGTGGVSHGYPFGTPLPNSVVRNDSTWGVAKLTLHPGGYDLDFVPVAGSTFTDHASGTCH